MEQGQNAFGDDRSASEADSADASSDVMTTSQG
jgi:hypothetical protein